MKRALIVVDMLNDFCHSEGVLARSMITNELYGAEIIPAVRAIVEASRIRFDPIFWLCDGHLEEDKEFDRFPKHAVLGTWGAEIIDELDPKQVASSSHEMRINKIRYSGFFNTDLEYQLMRLAPQEIVVVGVCTSICVMDTVGGLANRDYNITVLRAAVTDFDPAAHQNALSRMEGLYGAAII